MRSFVLMLVAAFMLPVSTASGQVRTGVAAKPILYEELMRLPVPVTASDIADRKYEVIGSVEAGVRKATVFSRDPSEQKVYRELWERGKKLNADAIINATYGEARITAFSWGKRQARGVAIRFLDELNSGSAESTNRK